MKFTNTIALSKSQKQEIFELWNREYPAKLGHASLSNFDNYLSELQDHSHILMSDDTGKIAGWYFDFIREGERWFAILLHNDFQGKGYGSQLLELAKEKETQLNGWVVDGDREKKSNGEAYISPLDFYLKNGFRLLSDKPFSIKNTAVLKIRWEK